MKTHTVKKHLESYGSIYVNTNGVEINEPYPMTWKQAVFIANVYGGFVVGR